MDLLLYIFIFIAIEETILFFWIRFVLLGLKFKRTIEKNAVYVGDVIDVKVEIFNYKILPIPWIKFVEDIPQHMKVHGLHLDITKTKLNNNLITITSLFAFQKLTRKFKIEPTRRGDYFFCDVELEIGDYFGLHKKKLTIKAEHRLIVYPKVYSLNKLLRLSKNPQGEVRVNRWIIPDLIDIVGVRQYTGSESFNMIDWKATAKTTELQVRNYDFHADPAIMIFLSLQTSEVEWFERNNVLAEKLIQVAASIVEEATMSKIAVGLSMTCALSEGAIKESILPKRTKNQREYLLETLAKATYYNTWDLDTLVKRNIKSITTNDSIVIIASIFTDDFIRSVNIYAQKGYRIVIVTFDENGTDVMSGFNSNVELLFIKEVDLEMITNQTA